MFTLVKKIYVALVAQNTTHEEKPLEFAKSDGRPETLRPRASLLLKDKNLVRDVLELTLEDQALFVDKVNEVYGTLDSQNTEDIAALGAVCNAIQRLPSSAVLLEGLRKSGNFAMASGGFTDIWRGRLNARHVVIKAFRINPAKGLTETKEILWKRIPAWMRLSHPNVLPFRGVDMTLFHLSLVYDQGENGNVLEYVASNPGVCRPTLLFGTAKGLEYLHSLGIPHGDLKGANVIIGRDGHPRLTEYGLASINSEQRFVDTSRWLAPEYATTAKGTASPNMETTAGDVFSFGMVGVEVFTGEVPFGNQTFKEAAVLCISRGKRPERPQNSLALGLTNEIWGLIESSWEQDPSKRPAMKEVVSRLRASVGNDGNLTVLPEGPRTTTGPGEWSGRRVAAPEVPQVHGPFPDVTALTRGNWLCALFCGVVITSIVFFRFT